jgi:N-acetylated-alpha-linked acidic dipeptidase
VQASAEDLLHHLQVWQQKAGDRFDLATVTDRAAEVAGLAAQFQARVNAAAAQRLTPEVARQLNAAITAVERPLVRLNYVQTDPYAHDPALSEPPVPLLAPLELLLAAPGSDAEHEVLTLLVRRRNRIRHELAEARQALCDGLAIAEQV